MATSLKPLRGVRVLSLSLNLPGPAALMRLRQMGATCVKLEPPAPKGAPAGSPGDPMAHYSATTYAEMHAGVRTVRADLKTDKGQAVLHRELTKADVLLTSFRPSALTKLGLAWKALHKQYPALSQVAIVGAPGARAEEPGHDLTYLADNDLITGLDLPATLYADMGGALMASEAVLQVVLQQRSAAAKIRARAKACFLKWPCPKPRAGWPGPAPGDSPCPAQPLAARMRATRSTPARTAGWRWRRWSRISPPPCARRWVCPSPAPRHCWHPPRRKPLPTGCSRRPASSWMRWQWPRTFRCTRCPEQPR